MPFTFKKFAYPDQIKQQQKLFCECFSEIIHEGDKNSQSGVKSYLWQYHSFPGRPSSREYVVMDQDNMIAYYAAIPYRYKIGDKEVESGMVCGVMTSPSYRKMGLFSKLGNYASEQQKEENVSFNFTFPIRKAVMPGFLKNGWDIAFELPLFVKFLKLSALMKSKKIGLLAIFFNPLLSLYNNIRCMPNNPDFEILTYNKIDEIRGYDDFQKKWALSVRNSLIKDKDFLKWRYGFPNRTVIYICAYNKHRLVGFVALTPITKMGVDSYGVIDFMVIDENCLSNLHNAMYEKSKIDDKEALLMMMSNYSSKKYMLIKNAFFKSPFKFNFIFKNLNKNCSKKELMNESSWHLMFVDSDDL